MSQIIKQIRAGNMQRLQSYCGSKVSFDGDGIGKIRIKKVAQLFMNQDKKFDFSTETADGMNWELIFDKDKVVFLSREIKPILGKPKEKEGIATVGWWDFAQGGIINASASDGGYFALLRSASVMRFDKKDEGMILISVIDNDDSKNHLASLIAIVDTKEKLQDVLHTLSERLKIYYSESMSETEAQADLNALSAYEFKEQELSITLPAI